MPTTLIRRTARLRDLALGRGTRLIRRGSSTPDPNVVVNPSFETNLDGWTFAKPANRVAGGHDGSFHAEIAVADSENDFSSRFESNADANIPAAVGEEWTLDIWVDGGSPVIGIRWRNGAEANVGFDQATNSGETVGDFTRWSVTATAPATTAFVHIEGYNNSASLVMGIDAASLVEVV